MVHAQNFCQYQICNSLVRIWAYKNADEKGRTILCRSKSRKKKQKRTEMNSVLIQLYWPISFPAS